MKVLKVPKIYLKCTETNIVHKIGFGPIQGLKNPMAKVYSTYGRSTGPKIQTNKKCYFLENLKIYPRPEFTFIG